MSAPYMSAPGSMAAHDDLRAAMTLYRLAEAAFDADPTDLQRIRDADRCWLEVGCHALNCGATGEEPNLEDWVMRRLNAYAVSMGRA